MQRRAVLRSVLLLVAWMVLLAAVLPASAQSTAPQPGDEVLFTFAVFGDNKSAGPWLERVFGDMQKAKVSFVVGMGDHYKLVGSREAFDPIVERTFGFERFWFTPGDNEEQFWGGYQGNVGSQLVYFRMHGVFDASGTPLRPEIRRWNPQMYDYHAALFVNDVPIHLVSVYKHDSMGMQASTQTWSKRMVSLLRDSIGGVEPWLVFAQDVRWYNGTFATGHALYYSDLLLSASKHVYEWYPNEGSGTCLAINTSQVGGGGSSWYAVMVLADKLVLLNISDAQYALQGSPSCFIKPLGSTWYLGDGPAWFSKLNEYAASVPTEWGPMPTAQATGVRRADLSRMDGPTQRVRLEGWEALGRDGSVALVTAIHGRCRLELIDLAGRPASVLMDEVVSAGYHTVRWDGRGTGGSPMAAGAYFLRATVGSHSATQGVLIR